MANTKRFHRHFETPGLPLYWIIIAYLHPDCLKCGKCVLACPTKIMTLKH